jgi:H+/Cl- antiporter ClcA
MVGGYLTLVNWCIDAVWKHAKLGLPWAGKVFVICLTGGLIIGLLNKFLGDYPLTIAEVLTQTRQEGHLDYHNWWKSFVLGLTVLASGGSVGPEASATVLTASMINWVGDRWRLAHFTDHFKLWTGSLKKEKLSALPRFHEMFASKRQQKLITTLLTLVGVVGLAIVLKIFPEEGVFGIHLRQIDWAWSSCWAILPALMVGFVFGWLFVKSGSLFAKIIQPNWSPIIKAVVFGLLLACAGLFSQDALFSGEFRIVPFAKEAMFLPPLYLICVAFIKLITTNFGFFMGWRGGTIFPAIFSSAAIGSALALIMPGSFQVTAAIVLSVSVTVILRRPLLTAILLILLVSIYLAPLVLVTCYLTAWIMKKFPILQP